MPAYGVGVGMNPGEIVRKIKEFENVQFISIEEVYSFSLLEKLTVDGIGIIVNPMSSAIYNKFYHGKFSKTGSIIRFDDVPALVLEDYKKDVLFLVYKARLAGTEINLDPLAHVFVVWHEFARRPQKLKFRFKPWQFYTGEIKYGRKVWKVKWMVRVPTRVSRSVMFLGSREDGNSLINIAFKYNHMKFNNRVFSRAEFPAAILYS